MSLRPLGVALVACACCLAGPRLAAQQVSAVADQSNKAKLVLLYPRAEAKDEAERSALGHATNAISDAASSSATTLRLADLAMHCDPGESIAAGPSWLPERLHPWWADCTADVEHELEAMCMDFQHMYTGRHLCCLAAVVVAAAPLANTDADQSMRDWYQREVVGNQPYYFRKSGVNEFFNRAGEWQLTVPIYLGAWALGSVFEDRPACSVVGQWGERTLRALLVGAPANGVLQYGLGGGRPGEGSHWRPFQDSNTVAGHGFVGAVPFLTAASMTRCRPLRWALFAASFGTTWTRIDRDAHYFSQAMIGWTIAYLATQSVNMTELEMRRLQITPVEMPQGGGGIGILIRY
jgi:hypothetical protein